MADHAAEEGFNTNPDKDARLKEGDALIVMGGGDQIARIHKKVQHGGKQPSFRGARTRGTGI